MDEERHNTPLAPTHIQRSDQQFDATTLKNFNHPTSSKLPVHILTAVVILSSISLLLATIFLRVDTPDVRLRSILSINNLNLQYTNQSRIYSLNMTMVAEVAIDNDNFGRYQYENCQAVVLYGNLTIGDGNINGGHVRGRYTSVMNVTMEVSSRRSSANENFTIENGLGMVELRSYANFRGRVHVANMVNRFQQVEMNCTMNLNLTSRTVNRLLCN